MKRFLAFLTSIGAVLTELSIRVVRIVRKTCQKFAHAAILPMRLISAAYVILDMEKSVTEGKLGMG